MTNGLVPKTTGGQNMLHYAAIALASFGVGMAFSGLLASMQTGSDSDSKVMSLVVAIIVGIVFVYVNTYKKLAQGGSVQHYFFVTAHSVFAGIATAMILNAIRAEITIGWIVMMLVGFLVFNIVAVLLHISPRIQADEPKEAQSV